MSAETITASSAALAGYDLADAYLPLAPTCCQFPPHRDLDR